MSFIDPTPKGGDPQVENCCVKGLLKAEKQVIFTAELLKYRAI